MRACLEPWLTLSRLAELTYSNASAPPKKGRRDSCALPSCQTHGISRNPMRRAFRRFAFLSSTRPSILYHRTAKRMTYLTFSRAVLLLVFASQIIPVRAQVHPPPSDRDLQSTDSLGEDLFLQSGSTGMVLVVVRDDQVFFRGYGETAPNSHQLPTRDSLLRLCSFTKIFTTDVLSKLVADRTVPPASLENWRMLLPIRRTSLSPTTVPAGAGFQTSVFVPFPVLRRSIQISRLIFSAMPCNPRRTNSMPLFSPSALSTRFICSTRPSFLTPNNADICWSAPTRMGRAPPPRPPLVVPDFTPPQTI